MELVLYIVLLMAMIMFAYFMLLFLKKWQNAQNEISELRLERFSLEAKTYSLEAEITMLKMQMEFLEKSSEYWYNKTSDKLDENINKEFL